jgi:hypothetical protein
MLMMIDDVIRLVSTVLWLCDCKAGTAFTLMFVAMSRAVRSLTGPSEHHLVNFAQSRAIDNLQSKHCKDINETLRRSENQEHFVASIRSTTAAS